MWDLHNGGRERADGGGNFLKIITESFFLNKVFCFLSAARFT